MVFTPKNQRMDTLEAERGEMHACWEWAHDETLLERWPTKAECDSKGWDRKSTVAAYHRKGIGLPSLQCFVSESWKAWAVPVLPRMVLREPALVFRVNLSRKWSQYLGFVTPDTFNGIEVVNYSHKPMQYQNPKRVILDHHLKYGRPNFGLGGFRNEL